MNLNYVMFDITNKCNFKCKHCYKEQSINTTDLNYNIIVSFLEQAKSNGYFPKVILSGGEPLMYRDLYKLLDLISIDHAIRLNTNSYFLYQHYLKLLKYKNLEVQISLDGYDDESYYGIRNNDCFERILKNSIAAHEAGLKIFFRSTITNKTITDYEKFIKLSKSIGIPLILRPIVNTGEKHQKDLIIKFDLLKKWHNECIIKGYTEYVGENIISPVCPLLKDEMTFSTLTIDNFGNVYPCMLLKSERFYMGNIIRDDFNKIFSNHGFIKDELIKIIKNPTCQKCGFRNQFGNGTCVVSCFLSNKDCVKTNVYGGL